jgi:hypothetical protein
MAIDEDALRAAFAGLRSRLDYIEVALGIYVRDEDLDKPKGDPTVRFAPRDWRGENYVQRRYSQCSPEFLESLAESLTWSANNPPSDPEKLEKHQKFAPGNRLDACRARTWARRLRRQAAVAAAKATEVRLAAAAAATGTLFADDDEEPNEDREQAARDAAMPLEGGPEDMLAPTGNASLFEDDGEGL